MHEQVWGWLATALPFVGVGVMAVLGAVLLRDVSARLRARWRRLRDAVER